jgi:hypothetical protein
MSKPMPARYRTTNWSSYNAALRKHRSLNLLSDSRGIVFLGDGEWHAHKHGIQGCRQWGKVHPATDTATTDIRAPEFTPSRGG